MVQPPPSAADLSAAPPPFNPIGNYELTGVLGRGGMGVVYRAVHLRLRKEVALKVLPPDRPLEAHALSRFDRELQAIGRLDHPHIVRAFDAGEDRGTHYLAMELIDGSDVAKIVRSRGALSIPYACEIARQAALGLQHIHEHRLVHRDIKPSNLLVAMTGQVKIADLGLARLRQESDHSQALTGAMLTETGQVLGTVDFMAPEQATEAADVDIRADLYSLGCTLYYMLAGRAPFTGPEYKSTPKKLLAHAMLPIPRLETLRADIPPELLEVVQRLLEKLPGDRQSTPLEVARQLERFAQSTGLAELSVAERSATCLDAQHATAEHAATTDRARRTPELVRSRSTILGETIRRTWRAHWKAALCIGGLLVGALSWRAGFYRGPTPEEDGQAGRPTPGHPAARDVSIPLKSHVWHPLLKSRPQPLLWPANPRVGTWSYDQELEQVTAHCQDTGLIALGDSKSRDFRLQLTMQSLPGTGGFGVFFGYHEPAREAGPKAGRFQRISLQPPVPGVPVSELVLSRTVSEIELESPARGTITQDVGLRSQALSLSQPAEVVIELVVAGSRVVSLTWGGVEMADALAVPADREHALTGEDFSGQFGVYFASGTAVIRHARILFLSEAP